ncbi:hypothetical protein PsYK624_045900 [Phanerochaete sordida]|uniref:Uncharacterized protein n=1 Tax=Phanerochaete sordida TaxID=48140 RepID=A0A9P3G3M9_9APHY|nr:hypothetical protein PsYK624_045900 [Phanerochaete sordida]
MSSTFPSVLLVPEDDISSGASGRLSTSTGKESISKESTTSAASASSENPLKAKSQDEVVADAERFAREHGLEAYVEVLKRVALVAQNPDALDRVPGLTDEEKAALRLEVEKPWSQPFMLYYLVVMCSLAACVQGVRELRICARAGLD